MVIEEYRKELEEVKRINKLNEEYEKYRHKQIKRLYHWARFQVFLIKLRGWINGKL